MQDSIMPIWQQMAVYTAQVTVAEGLGLGLAFYIIGLVIWRGNNNFHYVRLNAQVLISMSLIRYVSSYLIFHGPLREGVWPLLWIGFVVSGILTSAYTQHRKNIKRPIMPIGSTAMKG